MKIEIKNRLTESVLFSGEYESVKSCVEAAVRSRIDLIYADLRGADLSDANMIRAVLVCADLSGADLSGADLHGANLHGANLNGAVLIRVNLIRANLLRADLSGAMLLRTNLLCANLRDANLRDADLRGADLRGADLSGAELCRAHLSGADLIGAYLHGIELRAANLTPVRDDVWAMLSASPAEAAGLLSAINSGDIDGSRYEGECCGLVGTLAREAGTDYKNRTCLEPDSRRPAERFFSGIARGDTPKTSQFSRLASEWVKEWIERSSE